MSGRFDGRGTTAIVGVAESDLGAVGPDVTALELAAQAAGRALDDAGLTVRDVDGLFTHSAFFGMPAVVTAEYLGVRPRYLDSSAIGGASFVSHLRHASAAIAAGMCEVALITYGSNQRSASGGLITSAGSLLPSHESDFRPVGAVTGHALAAARHLHQYGTTREQLAEVAVAARAWARLNPKAWDRGELTIDDVLSSRLVSSPLRVKDCCLVTDGGGAVVLTSAERAKDLPRPPVYLLGSAETSSHMHISQMPDLTVTAASVTGPEALAAAGYGVADIDVVQVYDAFTISTLLFLEDLGFCAKGEGGAFIENGGIAPGGRLPVNTSGGGLSYCHPGMFGIFLTIEATRQIRGEAGDRQVPGTHLGLVHGNGGILASQATAILGDESTL